MSDSPPRADTWYRFTLPYRPGVSLDIQNDGHAHEDGSLQIAPTGNYSGQHWQLIPSGIAGYRLRTMYTSPGSYLELRAEDGFDLHMTPDAVADPSRWQIVPHANGTVKFMIEVSGCNYFLGSERDPAWFRGHRPVLATGENNTQIWVMEAVEKIAQEEFFVRSEARSWVRIHDAGSDAGRFLNIFTLEWQIDEPDEDAQPSDISWIPRFYQVRGSGVLGRRLNPDGEDCTMINVSDGFINARLIHDMRDVAAEGTVSQSLTRNEELYACTSSLVCVQHASHGAVAFVIKSGTLFRKTGSVPISDPQTAVPDWECEMVDDSARFTIDPRILRQVGLEDGIAPDFSWRDPGLDTAFRAQDSASVGLAYVGTLGVGARAVVDKVFCRGRFLARKVVRCRPDQQDEMRRELDALKQAQDHKHVIKVVGSYTQGRRILGVLLHPVAHCDLARAMQSFTEEEGSHFARRGPFGCFKPSFLELFGCLASGLAFLHTQGIQHQHINPSNILLTLDGPIFTGLDISKDSAEQTPLSAVIPSSRTLEYCAPEAAGFGQQDSSADVFSLGCVFFDLLVVLTGAAAVEEAKMHRLACYDGEENASSDWIRALVDGAGQDSRRAWESKVLSAINLMLNKDPALRPRASTVWTALQRLTREAEKGTLGYTPVCGKCCMSTDDELAAEPVMFPDVLA